MKRWSVNVSVLLLAALAWLLVPVPQPGESPPPDTLQRFLGGVADESRFERATAVRKLNFPADHGPHPSFRNEWWYFTGILRTPAGRPFGFELTFFRFALTASLSQPQASTWRANQVYSAHLAVSDVDAGEFHAFHRMARGARGLAGAVGAPFAVWIENWRIEGDRRWMLSAADAGVQIDLDLEARSQPVLNGDAGLSRKSAVPGNASYYYSIPRLHATGTLALAGEAFEVSGEVWLDREWSTSALGEDQTGWDWFALRLDDGTNLMYYRLRDLDGATHAYSGGTWSSASSAEALAAGDVELRALRYWESPEGARYPVAWHLALPDRKLRLTVEPLLDQQWLNFEVPYWEGAVRVHGWQDRRAIGGEGYVELTGYR